MPQVGGFPGGSEVKGKEGEGPVGFKKLVISQTSKLKFSFCAIDYADICD